MLGWRPRDLRLGYLPFLQGEGLAQFFSDPVFRSKLDAAPEEDVLGASVRALSIFSNLGLTWADLDWLRSRTDLPILVKGVLTAEDARIALEHGVDGIVVSNHGGRQVDGAVATLDALVEVRDALGDDATVLMDSGIRTGSDILKALALGADAVLARQAVRLRTRGRRAGWCRSGDQPARGRARRHARADRRQSGDRGRPHRS